MKIHLKCFAHLAKRFDCDYQMSTSKDVDDGTTIGKLIENSGVPDKDVKIIFVNGRVAGKDQALSDGDNITLVPATGGM